MIDVTLLGPPAVLRDGRPVFFDTRKALALLAYLVLADRTRSRDALAELLWPEHDIDHARGALRRTLSTLRGAIGPEAVEAGRDKVRIVTGPGLEVDVHRFRSRVAAGDPEVAVAEFRGEFLEGFSVRDAPEFEGWQRAEADALRRELAGVLDGLAAAREAAGDSVGALGLVRRWLALDSLHEPAHRAMIRLSALTGDRAGALAQYRECVRTLSRELGVPPLRETTLLYEAISQGTLDPPRSAEVPEPAAGTPTSAPLVGRDNELRSLLASYGAIRGHGRVAVIEGEAGIGKTRLAAEFLTRVRTRGAVTLVGRAFEEEAGLAYGPVIEILGNRLAEGSGWVEQLSAAARGEAARLLPELALTGGVVPAALDSPGAAATFLAGVWEALATAAAGRRSGVILIDDAQWADEATLHLLTYGLRRLAHWPLLVLLTWRTPPDHPIRRLAAELNRVGVGTRYPLGRLAEADVANWLRTARPGVPTPGFGTRLHMETEGLPFLLVEYLSALGTPPDPEWDLPAGARDLLRSRIDPVSETGRQVLSAAAVLGRSFGVETVRRTSGRSDDETVAALEELTRRGLIREGSRDYDFSHEQLRAVVYDETSLARRRLLHGRAAAAPLDTAIVARHLQLAGRDDEAAREYVRAAAHAGAVFAHAEAVGHLRSALALGHPERSTLHMSLGQLQTLQGDYAGALSSYETAAATATPTELSGIEHRLGQVHHRRGEWALAQARFQAALDAGSSRDVAARARITADLSLAAHAGGDSARAAKLAAAACSLAERAADTRALAQAHNLLGLLASSTGDSAAAVRHLQSSLALAEHVDDPGARVAALNNLALTHRGNGELAAAIRLTRSALDGCALLGDRHREAALHNNLADLLHITGETDQAMEHLKRAVSLFADVGADEGPQPEVWKLVQW